MTTHPVASSVLELTPELIHLFKEEGRQIVLETGYRFFLHSIDELLYFEEGDLDLFILEPHLEGSSFTEHTFHEMVKNNQLFLGDAIEGSLSFLGNLNTARLLFPFALHSSMKQPNYKVIALANSTVRLYTLPLAKIDVHTESHVIPQLESWVNWLSSLFPQYHRPHITVNLKSQMSSEGIALKDGDTVAFSHEEHINHPNHVCWLTIDGVLELLEIPAIDVSTNASTLYPLTFHLWLRSRGEARIQPFSLEDTTGKLPLLLKSLFYFEESLLRLVAYQQSQKIADERESYKQRKVQDRQLFDETVTSLSSILTHRREISLTANPKDRLLNACQLVGGYQNQTFISPLKAAAKTISDQIHEISQSSKIPFRRVLLSKSWWKQDEGALLGFVEADAQKNQGPVALIPTTPAQYACINPATGSSEKVDTETQAAALTPFAYQFYRTLPSVEKVSGLQVAKFCAQGRKREVLTILLLMLFNMVLALAIPLASKLLFDYAIPNLDGVMLSEIILGLTLVYLSLFLTSITREYTNLRLNTLIDHDLQVALWNRLLDLPVNFFKTLTVGNLMQRLSGVGTIRRTVGGHAIRVAFSTFYGMTYLLIMLYFSPLLTAVSMGILLLGAIITGIFFCINRNYEMTRQDLVGTLNGRIIQIIFGLSKIRTKGAENRIFAYWAKSSMPIRKLGLKIGMGNNLVAITNEVLYAVLTLAIFIAVMDMMEGGGLGMSIGSFIAFNTAFISFTTNFFQFSNTLLQITSIFPIWKRSSVILSQAPESGIHKAHPGKLLGELRIDHLSFRYELNGPLIHRDISLHASPGEFIAVVGVSGCGKSTLIRLILGFEKPIQGAIYYDGKDLANLDLKEVRSQLGVILQTSAIMDGSLRDNVTSGSVATDFEVIEALRKAGFEEDLKQFPMGIKTFLTTGGGTISAGQRQRILIARALLNHAKILIFDEATNALDNTTQEIVLKSLAELDATRIVIAHHLNTVMHADRIYVMDKGTIVDTGTYQELAGRPGLFQNMLEKQKL